MARLSIARLTPWLAGGLGLVLMVWGIVLNLIGQESTQSWSLIGIGAATLGGSGVSWRRIQRGGRPWS